MLIDSDAINLEVRWEGDFWFWNSPDFFIAPTNGFVRSLSLKLPQKYYSQLNLPYGGFALHVVLLTRLNFSSKDDDLHRIDS